METYATVLEETKKWKNVEAKAIQIILTGIDNDIYSIVDACLNAIEMWKAIERLKQVYFPQPNPTHYTQSSSTRSQTATRNKGKAIANSPPPTYESEPKIVADDEASLKEKEIDKLVALILMSFNKIYKPTNNNLRTSSNTKNLNVDNTSRSYRRTGHVARECKKAKRARDLAYHKEKMIMCKQEEAGIQLSAEQTDWRDDTDDEPEDQQLEAHYLQHPEQPEFVNDTYLVEQGDTNTTPYSSDMSNNEGEADQDEQMFQEERELLASLIEKMKIEINRSKQNNKSLKSSNKALREANTFLNNELKSFVKPQYLKKAQSVNKRLYDIGCYNDILALMLAPEFDEMIRLAKESRSKLSDLIKPFDYKNSNNLYELFVPNREKSAEQKYFSNDLRMSYTSEKNVYLKEKLNPTAKRLTNDVAEFYQTLKEEMVEDLKNFKSLENEVESLQSQLELQQTKFSNEIDQLSREYYYADHMKCYTWCV
ncbi:hypothetical protein Tco_1147606 [Tanacetum coccineum]